MWLTGCKVAVVRYLRRANVDGVAAWKVLNADAGNAPVGGAECVLDAVVREAGVVGAELVEQICRNVWTYAAVPEWLNGLKGTSESGRAPVPTSEPSWSSFEKKTLPKIWSRGVRK
jgi:hypothetical protein